MWLDVSCPNAPWESQLTVEKNEVGKDPECNSSLGLNSLFLDFLWSFDLPAPLLCFFFIEWNSMRLFIYPFKSAFNLEWKYWRYCGAVQCEIKRSPRDKMLVLADYCSFFINILSSLNLLWNHFFFHVSFQTESLCLSVWCVSGCTWGWSVWVHTSLCCMLGGLNVRR